MVKLAYTFDYDGSIGANYVKSAFSMQKLSVAMYEYTKERLHKNTYATAVRNVEFFWSISCNVIITLL